MAEILAMAFLIVIGVPIVMGCLLVTILFGALIWSIITGKKPPSLDNW